MVIYYIFTCLSFLFIISNVHAGSISKSDNLPFMIKTPVLKERFISPEYIMSDYKFQYKRYGINKFTIEWYSAFRKYIDRFPDSVVKDPNLFFQAYIAYCRHSDYFPFLLGISAEEGNKLMPFPFNNKGEELTNFGIWDMLHPDYRLKYVYPLINDYLYSMNSNNVVIDFCEYGLWQPCYSPADIKAIRDDLAGEDDGVEWIFPDGTIKKINFWDYAWFQLGMNKEEYAPHMLGSFANYKEYLPADIQPYGTAGDFIPSEGKLFRKIPPVIDVNYWKNIYLFLSVMRYEFFKHCQTISKYAKEKGVKYMVFGPGGGEPEICHDPYIDYVGERIIGGERFGVIPGTAPRLSTAGINKTITYIFRPYLVQLQNEAYNVASLGSIETGEPYRNPIAFYNDIFAQFLVGLTLGKLKSVNFEQTITPMLVDKDGMSGFSRQYVNGLIDATVQARESGLVEGRLYGSTWLTIPPAHEYQLFWGAGGYYQDLHNTGDMRSELVLAGYIPEVRFELGGLAIPDKYKIVTLAGTYYPDRTISLIKDWLSSGKGKTFVANYDYFVTHVFGSQESKPVRRKTDRFTELGIWKTSKVKDYTINKITWIDETVFPDIKADDITLSCVLPGGNIQENIPDEARVLMKGRTQDGEEVPLIIFVPHRENSIVNIVFPLGGESKSFNPEYKIKSDDRNLKFYSQVMLDLFDFLQREYKFDVTRVKAEPNLPMTLLFRMPVRDKKGICTIVARGDAVYGGGEEKYWTMDPVKLSFEGTEVVSKIKNRSMVIASLDGSSFASVSDISLNGKKYVKIKEDALWLLSSFDAMAYEESNGFHLWTAGPVELSLRLPGKWNSKEIEIYSLAGKKPNRIKFSIKDGFIMFNAPGGECKIYQSMPDQSMMAYMNQRVDNLNYERPFDLSGYLESLVWKSAKIDAHQQMSGLSWFRTNNVGIPDTWKDDSLVLQLGKHEDSSNAVLVYVNQQIVGYSYFHDYVPGRGNEPRRYIVPKTIWKYGQNNEILVRVEGQGVLKAPVRIMNPNKCEIINLAECSWEFAYSKKD